MKQIKKIAIISPSVMLSNRPLNQEKWLIYLENLGLEVKIMPSVYTTGNILDTFSAKEKAIDIMNAYIDESVDALVAAHGGASALRTLEYLDFDVIKHYNKPIIGFSDTTALQLAVYSKTGNDYITGFLPEYELRDEDVSTLVDEGLKEILTGQKRSVCSGECVHEGTIEGILIGGNLSTISDLSGTPYYPDLSNKILLLEDECEISYKLKLMLTQLKLNPTFGGVKGIIFGKFSECEDHITHGTVESVVEDFAAQVKIPMIKNFNYGHFKDRLVLRCGVKYNFDAKKTLLQQIEE